MHRPQCGECEKKLARPGTFAALGEGTQGGKCTVSVLVSIQTWVESQLLSVLCYQHCTSLEFRLNSFFFFSKKDLLGCHIYFFMFVY